MNWPLMCAGADRWRCQEVQRHHSAWDIASGRVRYARRLNTLSWVAEVYLPALPYDTIQCGRFTCAQKL